ncbi:hypothetical protein A9B99_16995 [Mangrovibacter phragmitis]|uniref:Phage tail protein n=1 Tax=Mangrovibacter phragmitis TaxID=1691903 RepID=A0A1B7KY31_9ENTR|nr:phage GP46 family protein [Mangrovibacter phragmitis]OAT74885.1 hypothetical protein A9B99_16995 [Mangrovibacter phragmitis]
MILVVNGAEQKVSDPMDALTRAVVISLFTWRHAETDDSPEDPNGWWGDTYPTQQNDRIGSRLYLLKRQKLTNKTPLKAREYVTQALAWLTSDGVAARVDVTAERTGLSTLYLAVMIYRNDGTTQEIRFNDLWSELNG